MADEIKKEQEKVEEKAAEAIETAEEKARKEAEQAAEEAKKIEKKEGEGAANQWLETRLTTISTNLQAEVAGVKTWLSEEMGKFQQAIFDKMKETLSTPVKSAETAEEQANRGSQSATKEEGKSAPAKKRRRI